ncbi:dolichol kinase-like isoform X2 [Stylophora pistillata]|nr:dolichol kinase-like isoform X2 [Stylophora pistillata]
MEIGSLLVPMVITSQMAFVEKWDSKYVFLKVTEVERSYLLASQLMSMFTASILLITNHVKPVMSSVFFFMVTTCIAATISIHLDVDIMWVSVSVSLYFVALFAILWWIPGCFTIGEAMIVTQAVVFVTIDSFANLGIKLAYLSPTFYNLFGIHAEATRGTLTLWMQLLVVGSLTTGLLLLPVFYYLTLVRDYWERVTGYMAFYAVLFFTFFALLLPWSVLILGGINPFVWLWDYLDFGDIRMPLVRYWFCVVLVAVGFVAWKSLRLQSSPTAPSTITRKVFHLLALAVFIPGVVYEPNVTHLASSVAVAAFIFIEYIRLYRIGPFGESIHSALEVFLDEKDSGPLILTHVYLLLGFAVPLWLYPVDYMIGDSIGCNLALYSGILSLGIGDTMASVVGKRFGRCRWPGGVKTVEGTLAGVASQLLFLWSLHYKGFLFLPEERWWSVSMAVICGSLLEGWTTQIDNIVLSPFLCSLLLFKCR